MKLSVAAALLLSTALLAGCSGSKDSNDAKLDAASSVAPILYLNVTVGNQTYRYTTATTASSSTSASASVSVTGNASKSSSGSKSNSTAPKGNGTKAVTTSTPTGAAPLNVSVTLGAKGIPSGKTASWTLDWGDGKAATGAKANGTASASSTSKASNSTSGTGSKAGANTTALTKAAGVETGTKLPSTVKHSYTEAGNRTIVFTLKVANATSATLKQAVKVSAANAGNATGNATGNGTGLAPGTPLGMVVLDQSGTFTASVQNLAGSCAGQSFTTQTTVDVPWTIPGNDSNGTKAVASHVKLVLDYGTSTIDAALAFIGPDGSTIGDADAAAPNGKTETYEGDGPFTAGDYVVKVSGCIAANGSWTLHGEGTLVAA